MSDELRTPPHAEGPEKSVLSSMLQDPEKFVPRAKAEGLTPSMFFIPSHAKLVRMLLEKSNAGETIELISFTDHLLKTGQLDSLGGASGISEIYTYAPTPAHFSEHLKIVRDRYAQRQAIATAQKVVEAAYEGETPQDALDALSRGVEYVRLATAQKKAFQTAEQARRAFVEAIKSRMEAGDMPGLSTGIHQLDFVGGGMVPGDYWLICGETSAGKSALAYQICTPAIDQGLRVLIFTLEMTVDEVFARLISCRERINLGALMDPKHGSPDGGNLNQGQMLAIKKGAKLLSESKLMICDEANMSIDYVVSQCQQEAENEPVDLIVVDYLQLLESTRARGESREQELSRISKQLRQLAKKLKCPVISPAQLNDDGKLRESRAIGHDATVVLKIRENGIHVSKYRNAARDQLLPLKLNGAIQRFETHYDNQ